MLCYALMQGQHTILKTLALDFCALTARCVRRLCTYLCTYLCNDDCDLNVIKYNCTDLGDEGVRLLPTDVLRREQCELTELALDGCNLSHHCLWPLYHTLEDRNCKLAKLSLGNNYVIINT